MSNELYTIHTTQITPSNTALMDSWADFIRCRSARTQETYSKALKQFFIFLQARGITQPTKTDIRDYVEYIKESHRPTTVNLYLQSIKVFFRWTEEEELYKNIAKNVVGCKLDTGYRKDNLTSAQAKALLQAPDRETLRGKRDYAILSLMLTAGLRDIEVIRANVEDMGTLGDSSVLRVMGKGHSEKIDVVKIAPVVEESIRLYLKARGKTEPTAPLFTSVANRNNGERLTTRSISRLVKTYLQEIGIDSERVTSHSLRHSAVTFALDQGESLQAVQMMARHKSETTTLIYAHNLDRRKNNSEITVANLLFN